jgi:hypothetical protein
MPTAGVNIVGAAGEARDAARVRCEDPHRDLGLPEPLTIAGCG